MFQPGTQRSKLASASSTSFSLFLSSADRLSIIYPFISAQTEGTAKKQPEGKLITFNLVAIIKNKQQQTTVSYNDNFKLREVLARERFPFNKQADEACREQLNIDKLLGEYNFGPLNPAVFMHDGITPLAVKLVPKGELLLDTTDEDTVQTVLRKIEHYLGIPAECQTLQLNGKQLHKDSLVGDFNQGPGILSLDPHASSDKQLEDKFDAMTKEVREMAKAQKEFLKFLSEQASGSTSTRKKKLSRGTQMQSEGSEDSEISNDGEQEEEGDEEEGKKKKEKEEESKNLSTKSRANRKGQDPKILSGNKASVSSQKRSRAR